MLVMPTEEARRRALAKHRKRVIDAHALQLSALPRAMWLALLAVSVLSKPDHTFTRLTAKD